MGAALIITFSILIFVSVWYLIDRYKTIKLLRTHQREWDKMKRTIADNSKLYDEYFLYIEKLYTKRGTYGACFPKM